VVFFLWHMSFLLQCLFPHLSLFPSY
jgi:hypothetical protein